MTGEQTEFFNGLMNKQAGKLINWAHRHTGDEELSKDAVQTVFLQLIVDIDEIFRHEAPNGWLYRTLRNVIGNELKKKKREIVGLTDEQLEAFDSAIESSYADKLLEVLPAGLKAEYEQIIRLRIEDRLSYQQIAQFLGLEVAAARQRMRRALRSCGELLPEEMKNIYLRCVTK